MSRKTLTSFLAPFQHYFCMVLEDILQFVEQVQSLWKNVRKVLLKIVIEHSRDTMHSCLSSLMLPDIPKYSLVEVLLSNTLIGL